MKHSAHNSVPRGSDDPVVHAIVTQRPSRTDPAGSYTGKPLDNAETPVQDADDL